MVYTLKQDEALRCMRATTHTYLATIFFAYDCSLRDETHGDGVCISAPSLFAACLHPYTIITH